MKEKLSLAVLVLSFVISTNAATFESLEENTDCVALAMDVYDAWDSQGFTDRYASGKADEAYNYCINHSTTPQSPEVVISDDTN